MATYHNAHKILEDVRRGMNEYSSAFLQGTDTSGAWSNVYLMSQINRAQSMLYSFLLKRNPDAFLKYADITGSSSAFALPSDFGVLKVFLDDNYKKVYRVGADQLKIKDGQGSDRLYYRKGDNLVLDKDGISDTYRLWYYWRCRELDQGQATAQDTLATTAKAIADYYNDMTIEDNTNDASYVISDYSAARACTMASGNLADDAYYGIVSDLPEEFHHLIAPRAIMYVKNSPQSTVPMSPGEVQDFRDDLITTLEAYAGTDLDEDFDEMFMDLEPMLPVNIGIL